MPLAEKTLSALNTLVAETVNERELFGAILRVESPSANISYCGYGGNITPKTHFFVASLTKMITAAITLDLRNKGKIALDDPIANYIDESWLSTIHRYKGKNYSFEVTIRQALSHTTGIPDYFREPTANGLTVYENILRGIDIDWTFEMIMDNTPNYIPKFAPGQKGKAEYSDTNFQLLGRIAERIYDMPLKEIVDVVIAKPLGLTHTYLFSDKTDTRPIDIYAGPRQVHIPRAMCSVGADGGVVSIADELLIFVKAFFTGQFFPPSQIEELTAEWRKIFYPLEAGVGLMRFRPPRARYPFRKRPEFFGYSGISGSFAYYCPDIDTYIAGTTNQALHLDVPMKLMAKAAEIIRQAMR